MELGADSVQYKLSRLFRMSFTYLPLNSYPTLHTTEPNYTVFQRWFNEKQTDMSYNTQVRLRQRLPTPLRTPLIR